MGQKIDVEEFCNLMKKGIERPEGTCEDAPDAAVFNLVEIAEELRFVLESTGGGRVRVGRPGGRLPGHQQPFAFVRPQTAGGHP
jgi:hypothetical protein